MEINEINLATTLAETDLIEEIMRDNNANVDQANDIATYLNEDDCVVYKDVYQDRFNDKYDNYLGIIHGCAEQSIEDNSKSVENIDVLTM